MDFSKLSDERPSEQLKSRKKQFMEPYNYRLLQSFGERRESCSQEDEDFISCLAFNNQGDYLSVGDRAGRLVFFKSSGNGVQQDDSPDRNHNLRYKRISSREFSPKFSPPPIEFEYLFDFQSHCSELDYIKSEIIDQKIQFIQWLENNGPEINFMSSNSKTVKLWRMKEKPRKKTPVSSTKLSLEYEPIYEPKLKKEYFKLHKYPINSISVSCNEEFMLSSDDLKIHLWSLNDPLKTYNIIDKSPIDMDFLSEVITCSKLSRSNCNLFVFGTSKGQVNLGDMRLGGVCDKTCLSFKSKAKKDKDTTFFSGLLQSISSCELSGNEDIIVARDYLNLKVWDLRNTKEPVKNLPINNDIKTNLCKLYENESIFDKFRVSLNSTGSLVLSGSYDDSFHLINLNNEDNYQFRIMENDEVVFKNVKNTDKKLNENSFSEKVISPKEKAKYVNRILQVEFNPQKNCLALACQNCLYLFGHTLKKK